MRIVFTFLYITQHYIGPIKNHKHDNLIARCGVMGLIFNSLWPVELKGYAFRKDDDEEGSDSEAAAAAAVRRVGEE